MQTITYTQLQDLVAKLPKDKLPMAYRLLEELTTPEPEVLSPQAAFMRLPIEERRRILREQAQQLAAYYAQTDKERLEWL
jgi:hypothetical protein